MRERVGKRSRSVKLGLILGVLVAAGAAWAARPYRGGAVATAHPVASAAALEMLEHGGNAVDATVAAAFALGVVAPYHSGIGGGGFALVHRVGAEAVVLDFRERAPRGASRDMYVRNGAVVPGLSTDGALSVAVPGAARGYLELLQRYGTLPPGVVLAPAIRAAHSGFWVTPKYRAMASSRKECLENDPEAARRFLVRKKDGSYDVPPIGHVLRQPELARTLEALAARGPKAFYEGSVADAIVSTVQKGGGVITREDLRAYETTLRQPLEGSYRGHRVLTMPPPSAGGVAVLQVLGALEQAGPVAYRDPPGVHLFLELLRRAYVDRTKHLGDPAFNDVPLDRLLAPDYLAQMLASVDRQRATSSQTLLPAPTGASTLKQGAVERSVGTTGVVGDAGVSGRDAGVSGRDAGVSGRDAGVVGRDAGVLGRDAGMVGRDAGMVARDAGVVGRDAGVVGRDVATFGRGAATVGRDAGMSGRDAGVEVRTPAFPEKKNTTHVSVIDRDGNAVAMTTTVNYGFGSCVVAKGTGVLLNDEMDDFSAQPFVPNAYGLVGSEANAIEPGKIPLSSMSPTLVFQKGRPEEVMLAVGSPGGSTIPTTVMQTILNIVDHGMDVSRAVSHGRVHHQYLPDVVMWDRWGAEPATLKALEQFGHTLRHEEAWGDAEAVYVDPETGLRYPASDPRNEGAAVGQD